MHDYAIFNHSRATIGRYLGVCSFLFASTLTSFFAALFALTGSSLFVGAGVSSAVVYFVFHIIFNKKAWKIKWLDIPDINGVWSVKGQTLGEDEKVKYNWDGELDISQNWEKILIFQETKISESKSYTATLEKIPTNKGGSVLHYAYKNIPKVGNYTEVQCHTGFCEITFNKDATSATGSYFNCNGRRTFGTMSLIKKENKK